MMTTSAESITASGAGTLGALDPRLRAGSEVAVDEVADAVQGIGGAPRAQAGVCVCFFSGLGPLALLASARIARPRRPYTEAEEACDAGGIPPTSDGRA